MTQDIKELVKRLRANLTGRLHEIVPLTTEAADALEALAGEVVAARKHGKLLNKMLGEAEAERDRLKAALQPFARFAKMFAEAREHRRGHVPVEPNAEWYARETKQGTYILTPGMFDEALSALGDAS